MIKRVIAGMWVFCCTVVLLGVALVSNASALGLGFYGGYGGDKADWDVDYNSTSVGNGTYQQNAEHKTFGFVMDTAVAKDKLFNYRLNLGYDTFLSKPGEGAYKYVMKGFVLENDFGFGIVREPSVRVWLGPELRISILSGEDRFNGTSGRNIDLFGVGVGLAIGVNVNLGEAVALGFKVAYLVNNYYGQGNGKTSLDSDADYIVKEKLPIASVALIFRIGSD